MNAPTPPNQIASWTPEASTRTRDAPRSNAAEENTQRNPTMTACHQRSRPDLLKRNKSGVARTPVARSVTGRTTAAPAPNGKLADTGKTGVIEALDSCSNPHTSQRSHLPSQSHTASPHRAEAYPSPRLPAPMNKICNPPGTEKPKTVRAAKISPTKAPQQK
jgi:hypothetical protein